jgi:hypothetical protein
MLMLNWLVNRLKKILFTLINSVILSILQKKIYNNKSGY